MKTVLFYIPLLSLVGAVCAQEFDFNTLGSFDESFYQSSISGKTITETQNEGIADSGAIKLPLDRESVTVATTKSAVSEWSMSSTTTIAGYFKTRITDWPAGSHRSLAFGLTTTPPTTPKVGSVYPTGSTIFTGLYPREFDSASSTMQVDFHVSTSNPDTATALTSAPVTLMANHWYFMETRFTATGTGVKVELALASVDEEGKLIELIAKKDLGWSKTQVSFNDGEPIHAFIYSRDPVRSGVELIDDLRIE